MGDIIELLLRTPKEDVLFITILFIILLWIIVKNSKPIISIIKSMHGHDEKSNDNKKEKNPDIDGHEHLTIELLRIIAEGNQEPTIFIDTKGIIHVFNNSAEHLTGYNFHEIEGMNIKILMDDKHSRHHDSYMKNYINNIDDHISIRVIGKTRPVDLKHKDGSLIPILLRVTHVHDGITGFWGTMTER